MAITASKIHRALSYVHATEKRDGRVSSVAYAIRHQGLSQQEAEILANALHIRPGEVDIPYEVARGEEIRAKMTRHTRSR